MKIVRALCILMCIFSLVGELCYADQEFNWYIVRKGNSTPEFPASSRLVGENGGVYIDFAAAESCRKTIYLTFDAGYENGNIKKILDIMREENVKGAFFILSNLIDKNPEIVEQMIDDGHLVCNHTYNHKNLCKLTDEEIISNIQRLESRYYDAFGREMEKIFRFPEGRYSLRTLQLLNKIGYKSVFWSMAYDDWDNLKQVPPDVAKSKLLSTTHDGAIILLHPTSSTNAIILHDLIKEWKSLGYSFGSLNDI